MANIKRITLLDGSVYSIFDEGAIRLNSDGILITGNDIVDSAILQGHLYITAIDDVAVGEGITNVLTQDSQTGEIKKRSTDKLLEDIGGASYSVDDSNGILALKIGRQEEPEEPEED